jgi:hypothetical protein
MYNRNNMEINKAYWSTKDDNVNLVMPITKIDVERRIVSGFATLDNLDRQGDIVPTDASLRAFEKFRGNLREMHQPIAVGKVVSFKEDTYFDPETRKMYNGVYISAYVSKGAQDTWEKVVDGTLTGFSIGGSIDESDDVYNEDVNKICRVIKEYSLSELSLVDNPANQFANILSIEKGQIAGYLSKATIENVFWCKSDDIVTMSFNQNNCCPQCDKAMTNIGFVESNDNDKTTVIKSILKRIKKSEIFKDIEENSFVKFDGMYGKVIQVITNGGARLSSEEVVVVAKSDNPVVVIKVYSQNQGIIVPTSRRVIKNISSLEKVNAINKSEVKEVSKMESEIIVVDEIEKAMPGQTEPPMQSAMPVKEETVKAVEIEIEEEDETEDMTEEEDDAMKGMYAGDKMPEEDMTTKANTPSVVSEEDVNATTKMVGDITNSISTVLSTLAETVKALDAKIEGINKSIAGISSEVNEVKDNFGKRVDAVEKDTAFRKSADLGEILQEEPVIVEKSTWGGRFLNKADLF